MKTSVFTALVATAVASSAFAGLKAEMRADLTNVTGDTKGTTASTSNFNFSRMKLVGSGNVDSEISYYFRLDGRVASGTTNTRENASDFVEYGYLTHKVMPSLAVSFGKIGVFGGGWENDYNGADVYLFSTAVFPITNQTGAQLDYTFGDHTLSAQVTNPYTDIKNGGATNKQTSNAYALQWRGSFMGNLNVLAQYASTPKDSAVKSGSLNNYMAVGLQYNGGAYIVDLDYLSNTLQNQTTASKDDGTTATALNVAVPMDAWKGIVKYYVGQTNVSGNKTQDNTGFGLAAEYHPKNTSDINYHLAYNSVTTSPVTGSNTTDTTVLAGAKFFVDVLK